MLTQIIRKWQLHWYRKRGLQIADDCRLVGLPDFGSEPYLISIGKHVTITARVSFITHDGGTWVFRGQPGCDQVIKYGRITIYDNCFIGYGSTILPGVSIGPNSIVAAGSIVTKDVAPDTVVGGVPAQFIMSLQDYRVKSLAKTPNYDPQAYHVDKTKELLRIMPRPW
jgi:acetyltransferase-like isoleucine patch superfamily enzyme